MTLKNDLIHQVIILIDRCLQEKDKKVIGFMKCELRGKTLTEFAALRPKIFSYFKDDDSSNKKAKGTKKCVTKGILKFNDCKNCLFKNKITLKSQRSYKSEAHNVYTEQINKIASISNDDKILQTFHRITTYPHGYKQ